MNAEYIPDIVIATVVGLGAEDNDKATAAARIWARCLTRACDAAGVGVPELEPYDLGDTTWYGFRVGRADSQIDCGFGVHGEHQVIRVLIRTSDLHLWRPLEALLKVFGLQAGDAYYFGLDGAEQMGILLGNKRVPDFYGRVGEEAIIEAIRQVLTYGK